MKKRFIIKVMYGGLGDHLFYSHLPRIAKEKCGFSEVLVSNLSEYRNIEYRELVWKMNPFVDGFCDEDAPYPYSLEFSDDMNLLDSIMINRGLDDGKRFHEPEIYYKPRLRSEYSQITIYDPNYITYAGEISILRLRHLLSIEKIVQIQPSEKAYAIDNIDIIDRPKSIYEYCDLLYSCKQFYCLTSGGATLSPAIGVCANVIYGYGPKIHWLRFHHSKKNRYIELAPRFMIVRRVYRRVSRIYENYLRIS